MERRLDELTDAVAAAKADLAAQKTRLDAAITDQADRFAANLSEWTQQVEAVATTAQTSSDEQQAKIDSQAAAHQETLQQLVDKSRGMVEVTARNTISTGYAQYARRQGGAATAWSVAAVLLAIAGLVAIFRLIKDVSEVNLPESIFKATLSTAVLATAGFMA